ncbi:hypothetical protein DH2020_037646 [Rehmannia glutinosa]|uniref:DUF3741 domain-containing protein n=1 Tax=Rehmannia glutinosa TaxID=99300 RepID=A0ABR0V2T3_REHGL
MEVQKQKPRASTESSQASNSSSSCSSTFSSLDHNKTAKPETHSLKQTNISESPFHIKAKKEQPPSLTKGLQSPDIRHVVKDSMYREARGVSIKSFTTDERKVTVMKHIDSPRLLQHSKLGKPRPMVNESKKDSRDERLTLHRFSYDGRESGDAFKTTLKLKEQLPRLSLDSKASSMKCSALDSRLNFLPLNQEPGNHTRSSSIVAKLMGLDDIPVPDTITTGESKITNTKSSPSPSPRVASLSKSSTTTEENKEKRTSFSSSPKLHNANSVTKPTTSSRLPMEPAPWKQRDTRQGSQKMEAQSRKSPTSTPILPTSSVYAEMEKRITEIEFKRSEKDLRALKQILEAMQKTRERLENQRGQSAELPKQERCSLEDSCSNQDSPMWQNRRTYQQFVIIKENCPPKQLCSSTRITKSAKVTEKVKFSSSGKVSRVEKTHAQGLQTQDPKYHRDEPASREKPKDFRPRNNDMKEPSRQVSSTDKKTTWRNLEQERTLRTPPRMRIENCSTSGRGFEMVSPRLQQNVLRIEGESHPTIPSSESGRKKHSSRKARENCSQYRKNKVKSMDFQLSEDQLSELNSEPRYSSYQGETASVKSESNNSIASHLETEVISLVSSTNPNSRKQQASKSRVSGIIFVD